MANPRFNRPKPPAGSLGRPLPRPGDPLVLADGTIVKEEVRHEPLKLGATTLSTDPTNFRPAGKRIIRDFPANTQMFKALSVVFSFTMYGISNLEICDELGIDVDQLNELRAHHGYQELFNSVFSEFINANSDMLQSRIAAYSAAAVSKIGHLSTHGKKEETQLAASKDILDRAGMRPQDLEKVQAASMNELQIRITKKSDDVVVDVKVGKSPDPTRGNGENYG